MVSVISLSTILGTSFISSKNGTSKISQTPKPGSLGWCGSPSEYAVRDGKPASLGFLDLLNPENTTTTLLSCFGVCTPKVDKFRITCEKIGGKSMKIPIYNLPFCGWHHPWILLKVSPPEANSPGDSKLQSTQVTLSQKDWGDILSLSICSMLCLEAHNPFLVINPPRCWDTTSTDEETCWSRECGTRVIVSLSSRTPYLSAVQETHVQGWAGCPRKGPNMPGRKHAISLIPITESVRISECFWFTRDCCCNQPIIITGDWDSWFTPFFGWELPGQAQPPSTHWLTYQPRRCAESSHTGARAFCCGGLNKTSTNGVKSNCVILYTSIKYIMIYHDYKCIL